MTVLLSRSRVRSIDSGFFLSFFIHFFILFQLYSLILGWLGIRLYKLCQVVFNEVILVL